MQVISGTAYGKCPTSAQSVTETLKQDPLQRVPLLRYPGNSSLVSQEEGDLGTVSQTSSTCTADLYQILTFDCIIVSVVTS